MTTIPSPRSLHRALAFLLLAAAALPAAAVTVDDFTTNQATISDPPGGASSVATAGADIVGLHRDLVVDILAGAGPVSAGVAGGTLSVAVTDTTPDSRGQAVVTWDGDSDPNALDATGLSPLDLTASGHSAFALTVASAGAGSEIVFEVYTDAGNMSRAALRLPLVAASTVFHLSFARDFVAVLGSGADFTDVGAVVMTVRGTETSVVIDKVETEAPSLAVTKVDLTTSDVPIGATPQSPGTTIRYRVTITNTGGEAKGVTLADVVDANTTLAAATVDATPVAVDDAYDTFGNVPLSIPVGTGLLANDADPDTVGAPPELVVTTTGTIATALGGSAVVAADGSFEYDPPVGAQKSVDTFSYTVQDNDGNSTSATAKIHIGRRIWFVDDVHPGADLGTRNDPFVGLDAANLAGAGGVGDQDGPGDVLYFYEGTHPTAGLQLEDGQEVFGAGVALVVDGQTVLAAGTHPTLTHAGGNVLTLASGNSLRGLHLGNAAAGAFRLVGNSFGTLTVSDASITGTGGALSLTNGTVAVALSGITATSPTVRGVLLDNVGGSLSVSGSTTVTSSADDSLRIANAPASASYSFGTTSLSTNGAANGLELQSNAASVTTSFGSLAITTNNGTGLFASSGGTLSVGGAMNTIVATGTAVDVTSTSFGAGATFSTVSSSSSAGKGINLDTVSGAFVATGGSITGSAGVAFDVNAGSSTITYGGSITNGANRSVEVTGRTGGTVTVSGAVSDGGTGVNVASNTGGTIVLSGSFTGTAASAVYNVQTNSGGATVNFTGSTKTLSTGASTAVNVASNTGANVNFTGGGLAVTTTSGTGMNATGGGNVTVQGSGNTLTSTTGTALNVNATTIAAAGMTFQSISSNGGGNSGIVLTNSCGAAVICNSAAGVGGLTVAGGTIQNKTVDGISLNNARSISLSNMLITSNAGSGIFGDDVTDFSLSGSTVTNNTDTTGGAEAGLRFNELLGNCALTNNTIANNYYDNVRITPASGVLTNLAITGGTIGPNDGAVGNNGVTFSASGTADVTLNVSGTTFQNNRASAFLAQHTGSSTGKMTLSITSAMFNDGNIAIDLLPANSADFTFTISGNTIIGADSNAINFSSASSSTNTGDIVGTITGNAIGNAAVVDSGSRDAYGIGIDAIGDANMILAITNNTIRHTDFEGIFVESAFDDIDADAETARLDLTIRDNDVGQPDDNSAFPFGVMYGVRIEARHTSTLCMDMAGNNAASVGGVEHFRVRQRNTGIFQVERLTDGDGIPNEVITNMPTVEAFLAGQNDLGSTVDATNQTAGVTGFTEVADGFCRNP